MRTGHSQLPVERPHCPLQFPATPKTLLSVHYMHCKMCLISLMYHSHFVSHKILLRLAGITLWVTFACQENITFATLNMASMAQRLGEVILPCDGCNVLQCAPLCLASRRLTPLGHKPWYIQWSLAVEVMHGAKSTIVDCTISRRVDI